MKPNNIRRLRSLALSACLFTLYIIPCALLSVPVWGALARAQGCNGIGQVSPLYVYANIRGQAGNTTATAIATVQKGTSVPVSGTQTVRGNETWFALCGGGYVSGGVVSYSAFTATVAPTRTPTVAVRTQVTPTRLPSSTPGASPTPTGTPSVSRITVFEMSDGSIRVDGYCVQACSWNFDMENLP